MKTEKVKLIIENGECVDAMTPVIVSASRATDIPAFYAEWFFKRLEKGYCVWRNPFSGKDSYVSFANTRFVVFWSKNPKPLLPYLHILNDKGINCYVQFTLNDYVAEGLEPGVPPLQERIDTFKSLSERLGKTGVIWRFDPLILTDKIGIDELLGKIAAMAEQLKDYTDKLVFSFADISTYAKVKRNLDAYGVHYREWLESDMIEFASRLSFINKERGWNLRLATCGERIDLSEFGIEHNRCIDDDQIVRIAWRDSELMSHLGMEISEAQKSLFGEETMPEDAIRISDCLYAMRSRSNKAGGQRKFCGCIESKDIGQYNTCAHRCLYCYANTSPSQAAANFASYSASNNYEKLI